MESRSDVVQISHESLCLAVPSAAVGAEVSCMPSVTLTTILLLIPSSLPSSFLAHSPPHS